MEFLYENAKMFEELALENFEKGRYKFVAFAIEQAIQLYLKYILAKKLGDYPKTHDLSLLFKEASKICNKLKDFYEKHALEIKAIYDAYFQTRYFPTEYTKEEVEKMLKVFKEFKEILKECL